MKIAELYVHSEIKSVVVNMEHSAFDRGLAQTLADSLHAQCYNLPALKAETLLQTVQEIMD